MKECNTPWDSCCEPADKVAAESISVQVVGPDGRPLKTTLKTAGIAPMKHLIVAGTMKSQGGSMLIEAKQIYVEP
jgi:hypothetical protein